MTGAKLGLLLAGIAGGVSALLLRENISRKEMFGSIFIGTACAWYVTPVLVEHFALTEAYAGAVGYFLGIIGMMATGGVMTLAQRFRKAPLKTIKDIQTLKDGGEDG